VWQDRIVLWRVVIMTTVADRNTIAEILETSTRLRFILEHDNDLPIGDIVSIRLDVDRTRVEIRTEEGSFRFKSRNGSVLLKNPETGSAEWIDDPALSDGLIEILDDFDSQ